MSRTAPTGSLFIRPAGAGYGYCYRVISITNGQYHLERWGKKDNLPFDDGHVNDGHYIHLKEILPGLWKDEWEFNTPRWSCCPLYYKRIDAPLGQKELF